VVGKKADVVKKFLFILSYFIRCSDIMETSDSGNLDKFLETLDIGVGAESPTDPSHIITDATPTNGDINLNRLSVATPVNELHECQPLNLNSNETNNTGDMSFMSMGLDSLLDSEGASADQDCNSNSESMKHQQCEACNANRNEGNRVGNSVFYFSNSSCVCDKSNGAQLSTNSNSESTDCDNRERIQKKKEGLKLSLVIPKESFSDNELDNKCKLSTVDILDSPKRERMQHHRNSSCGSIRQLPTTCDRSETYLNSVKSAENSKPLSKGEIMAAYLDHRSNSMFNEYFEDDAIEAKTIDEIDEMDRIVPLPDRKRHTSLHASNFKLEDHLKAPSLPDLSSVKLGSLSCSGDDGTHRTRLGSMGSDNPYKFRRSSLSRQISEASSKTVKNGPNKSRLEVF